MIARLATPLFVKIGGGIILSLLVALGISVMLYKGERRHSAKLQTRVIESEAMLSVQNAAVDALRLEGERKAAEAKAALAEARKASERVEVTAKVLERERPLSGKCETPPEIMGAGL